MNFSVLKVFVKFGSMDESMEAACVNLAFFCYVCGHFVPKRRRSKIDQKTKVYPKFKTGYLEYYKAHHVEDSFHQSWTPNTVCRFCSSRMAEWISGKAVEMPYGKPVIWKEDPLGHNEITCYGCVNATQGRNKRNSKDFGYIPTPTAELAIPHCEANPVPPPPKVSPTSTEMSGQTSTMLTDPADLDFEDKEPPSEPVLLTQAELDYIVAVLCLSQRLAEFLVRFLKKRNLTERSVKITAYRQRQAEFQQLYTTKKTHMHTATILKI